MISIVSYFAGVNVHFQSVVTVDDNSHQDSVQSQSILGRMSANRSSEKRIATRTFPEDLTVYQFISQCMYDMHAISITDHIAQQALKEDIDPITLDLMSEEGII